MSTIHEIRSPIHLSTPREIALNSRWNTDHLSEAEATAERDRRLDILWRQHVRLSETGALKVMSPEDFLGLLPVAVPSHPAAKLTMSEIAHRAVGRFLPIDGISSVRDQLEAEGRILVVRLSHPRKKILVSRA